MDSGLSENRRIPQQERGERRVAELLEAAASEFADAGLDAATMKAIAKRAGASVGAVYQYFPNKQALISALRAQYVNTMEDRWMAIEKATATSSLKERAHSFVDLMIGFLEEHPAYLTILDAPADSRRDKVMRNRLSDQLARVLHVRRPRLSQDQAHRVARICLLMIKDMNVLYAKATPQERPEIVKEYKIALTAYLEERLA